MTAPRILFVHAHPDDESSKGSATASKYVDAGAEVVLLCLTDGSAGEVLNPSHPAVEQLDMPGVRQRELDRATEIIGFTRVHQLGETDSGWHEDLATVPDDVFYTRPVEGPARRVAAILRAERPHVVVTYAPDGGYPHPDHIQTHVVTMAAVELAADPDVDLSDALDAGPIGAREGGLDGELDGHVGEAPGLAERAWDVPRVVYGTGFPMERTRAVHDAMLERGLESPYEDWFERYEERGPRDADKPADVRVLVSEWFPRRDEALLAHATQVDPDGAWFGVPRDLETDVYPWETYVLLRGEPYPDDADDLVSGLDLGD